MQLSKHFKLEEFEKSMTAVRKGMVKILVFLGTIATACISFLNFR